MRIAHSKTLIIQLKIFLIGICLAVPARAETVNLKSGQRLENVKILAKTTDLVKVYNYKIREDGSDYGFVIEYSPREIEKIEPDKTKRSNSVAFNKIVFKTGKVIYAEISQANAENIEIEEPGSEPKLYAWDEVESINGNKADEVKKQVAENK